MGPGKSVRYKGVFTNQGCSLWEVSLYRNVRIFLKLPYPTKRACAVIHIRPKVSPTKMNRINRPRNSQNTTGVVNNGKIPTSASPLHLQNPLTASSNIHRFMQRAVFPSSGRVFAFQDGGFCRYPSTGRRRQTGRPNARPRTGCITRRTYFVRIIFKVLRLVYYCASVGADFYSFSYRTSCDLVARDQNLSPLAQPGFWRWLPAGRNRLCLHSCSIVCLVIVPIPINRWPSGNGSSSGRQVFD